MSNWLQGYTKSCCDELSKIATILQNMEDAFLKANDKYYQDAQGASDPKIYQGQGATAFIAAVNADINKSKSSIEGLGHVASATTILQTAITNTSQYYDRKLAAIANDFQISPYLADLFPYGVPQSTFDDWRDQLITKTLDGAGTHQQLLDDILRNGDKCILSAWGFAFRSVENIVQRDAVSNASVSGGLDGIINTIKNTLTQAQQAFDHPFVLAFHDLANAIKPLLQHWANDIEYEYPTFQKTLSNFNYLSARDLFYYIGNNVDATQNTDKPITITPYTTKDKKKGLLITIGGTDITHLWDTSLLTALATGAGSPNNGYMSAVKAAIQEYMDEHPEMKGADVTFAGYSLGGMVAQNWAQILTKDAASGQRTDLSGYDLHVTNVVTYGAPVMGPPAHGVKYAMYDATYDPIPLLSNYENPLINPNLTLGFVLNGLAGIPLGNKNGIELAALYSSITDADQESWQQKLNTYIDPGTHPYKGEIFNINDVGNVSNGSGVLHTLNMNNHTQYTISNQLNAEVTNKALPDINPQSLGPTEYFGSYAPVS